MNQENKIFPNTSTVVTPAKPTLRPSHAWWLITLNILALGALMGMGWYLSRQVNTYRDNQQALALRQSELSSEAAWSELLEQTREAREKIHRSIVDSEHLPDFIEALERTGANVGVKLEINTATLGDSGNKNIRLDFNVTGSENQVWSLVKAIEQLPYQLSLTQVDLSAVGGDQKGSGWDGALRLELLSV